MSIDAPATPTVSRFVHGVNWLGLWTVYLKEVRRFVNVFTQTILAPIATTLLFLAVFALSLGNRGEIGGVPYAVFLAPGLTIMAMVQNAFANTSSSIMIAKLQGSIVDMLMPPLSAAELTIGYAAAGATRGLVVGVAVGAALYPFAPYTIDNWGLVIFHGLAGSLMLSLLGIMGALWSEKFDHIAAVTNFVVTPFAFLSGTFYSIERLPPAAQTVARLNPFFYMIDGFRAGMIGHADASLPLGVAVMIGVNLALGLVTYRMFATGYKLKA
jgi:ABC-2 type transport system permease protein